MITKTVTLYTFDELTPKAKERAREWWRECEAQEFGDDPYLLEPIETAAKLLGIEFKQREVPLMSGKSRSAPCVWWTLHVQGAGASFDGQYSYARGSGKAIKQEFPTDTTLHTIAANLAELQKAYRYAVTATVQSNSRHSLDVECEGFPGNVTNDSAFQVELERFARWIYKTIDEEYDSHMEDEYVDDAILANEYTFLENGKRED